MKVFTIIPLILLLVPMKVRADVSKPNIVILLTDDMGYGDVSCYGHPLIRTPRIDKLASEGMRLTSFVTACWCVPSRTQLMTGRYMPRVDFGGGTGSDGKGGGCRIRN